MYDNILSIGIGIAQSTKANVILQTSNRYKEFD